MQTRLFVRQLVQANSKANVNAPYFIWYICITFLLSLCEEKPPMSGGFTSDQRHYNDVIMGAMASQMTSLPIVYSTVYSGADQRKHQRSASLAFVRGIHRGPVNSPHKWPVTRKMFPFDDIIMECRERSHVKTSLWFLTQTLYSLRCTGPLCKQGLPVDWQRSGYTVVTQQLNWKDQGQSSTKLEYTVAQLQWNGNILSQEV